MLKTKDSKSKLDKCPGFLLTLVKDFISVQHIEFFHKGHFEKNYYRAEPPRTLSHFIDFFWETDFDLLWKQYPKGFSDVLFPNIGYTYLINLGTPFIMQVEDRKFEMRTNGFLPRHKSIECHHRVGNKLFGIKFKISPIIFQKKINFAEYREYIFPLSYLLEQSIIDKVKAAVTFTARIKILSHYFQLILKKYPGPVAHVHIVSSILQYCEKENHFSVTIKEFADKHKISTRTLQRYFEMTTSVGGKKALQIMRIRKAVTRLANSPKSFHYSQYGYYDHSHFYKHLKQFLNKKRLKQLQPHLKLLEKIHK